MKVMSHIFTQLECGLTKVQSLNPEPKILFFFFLRFFLFLFLICFFFLLKDNCFTEFCCFLSNLNIILSTVHTACIYRDPTASSIYWTITRKSKHSYPSTNSQKIPSLCHVPRCLQTLFLQNFILAVGLTNEVKLGYCRLTYYAFSLIQE